MPDQEPAAQLRVSGRPVAEYVLAPDLDPTLVPRPYLHPIRTLAGTTVTDVLPPDHEWHLGAGLAIPDVAGTNLWGGRTYVHGKGYIWLPDHGRIEHVAWHQPSDRSAIVLDHDLIWRDHNATPLLTEHRTITASSAPTPDAWILTFKTTLTNVRPTSIEIRSPATNGRGDGAAYGGFFWRLPPTPAMATALTVEARNPQTADRARGEAFTNGSALPELVVTGSTEGSEGKRFRLTFSGLADADRWFVRAAEYPAVGVAFAASRPLILAPGATLARTFTVTVADT
jgi:Methane oxygenase PmoA